jgi:hypothetical protein
MGDPFTVVILVAAGSAADPTTYAIERSASAALGRSARVLVREAAAAPTDAEALAAAPAGPCAIVEMSWSDRAHHAAVLRVHVAGNDAGNGASNGAGSGRWLDRTIGFGPNDADAERARTLGFALASMIPDAAAAPEPEEPPPPAPSASVSPGLPPVAEPDRAEPDSWISPGHFALDMFAVGAAGLGSPVQTAGAEGALEAFLTPPFSLRFGGSVRAGSVSVAHGSVLSLMGTAGVAIHPWRPGRGRPFGASFRVDYVIAGQSLSHDSPAGSTTSTRSRALSGADAVAELEWRCAPGVELLLGAGIEEVFATTYVDLNGLRVATLPPTSALGEAGLRLPF